MKNVIATFVLTAFAALSMQAQTVTGKWKTIDDETGKAKSIVEISEKKTESFTVKWLRF